MEENQKYEHLKKKTIFSTLSLFFQSGYSAVLGLVANLVLTILFSPKIFGIYFTVLSIIAVLNYFSDIGLAASLIQEKKISEDDKKTVFTVQGILIIIIVFLGWLATPKILSFYQLSSPGKFLYWSLLFSFFISSFKTIPSVILERKIEFQKIVFVQVVENTFFYLSVIVFAIFGFGLNSFSIAVILRGIVGTIFIFYLSFWMPRIGINRESLKKLLKFGLPFQASSFLALFKDDLLTLYLGKVLGFQDLGYIGWAKKWAESSIRIIMDNISRVLFPLFSQFQQNRKRLGKIMGKVIRFQSLLILPAIFGLGLIMNQIVAIIPKYSKWQPALPLFYLFSLSALLSSFSTPFINLFNGLGKAKLSFIFMFFWTIATWILVPILTHLYGMFGFPLTLIILSSTFVIVVWQAKKFIQFSLLKNIYPPLVASLIMSFFVYLVLQLPFSSLTLLPGAVLLGGAIYFIILHFRFKIDMLGQIRNLLKK